MTNAGSSWVDFFYLKENRSFSKSFSCKGTQIKPEGSMPDHLIHPH